jgi:probable F420-dependent oxidoreductase
MSAAMEFGLSLPGRGPLATPDSILKLATSADRLGYHALFVTDHVVLPASMARSVYPYSSTGHLPGGAAQDYLEPLAVLAWLAHVTRKIRIGTSVLVIPYRNPVVTAKTLATIDRLSNGRVILGAGVGWLREEFEALAAPPFEARGAVTDEYLQLMRATWTTDPVRFEGKHYTVRNVHALPKPVQRHGIPIWIGGHTDAAVKRAATLGDAWHPIALRPPGLLLPAEYATRVKQLHAWAQRAGRDPKSIALTLRVPMEVRAKTAKTPAGDRPMFQGTAAEIRDDLRAYAALGVSHVIFDAAHSDLKSMLQNMERFANDVRPLVASGARPARAAGGPIETRRGARPARAAGGPIEKRRGSVVASGARPARAAGGPTEKRRGSAPVTSRPKKRR